MTGLDPTRWHDLFVAEAGAAAALTGLLFVAISINLKQVLAFPTLPIRAASSLVALVVALVVSTLVLVPDQGYVTLGSEILAVSAPAWFAMLIARMRHGHSEHQSSFEYGLELGLLNVAMLPFVAAGFSLLAGGGGGLYWTVPAIVFVFIAAADNAWVLLVEIMR